MRVDKAALQIFMAEIFLAAAIAIELIEYRRQLIGYLVGRPDCS
jgi:hypothetical protein